jgi:glycosyltransferase involved in cell wall biosynthesis
MRVTLIVTTYNWPQALGLTLASVARQATPPHEVIVADDGSGPETAQTVQRWRAQLRCPVKHVWQEDSGFRLARSRNRALAASEGDYIVLVDGDMILHRRFVEDHMACALYPGCATATFRGGHAAPAEERRARRQRLQPGPGAAQLRAAQRAPQPLHLEDPADARRHPGLQPIVLAPARGASERL